jgi:hypothetical protein
MKELIVNDKMGSRSLRAFCIFIFQGLIYPFFIRKMEPDFEKIKDFAVLKDKTYSRNGKWSYTQWTLSFKDEVQVLEGHQGWNTSTYREGFARAAGMSSIQGWEDMQKAFYGVEIPVIRRFLADVGLQNLADDLDEIEDAMERLSSKKSEAKSVLVTFGSPTRRSAENGYWNEPKTIPGFKNASIQKIDADKGWGNPENIQILGIKGQITDLQHTSGRAGGFYDVTLLVDPASYVGDDAGKDDLFVEPETGEVVVREKSQEQLAASPFASLQGKIK